MRGYAVVLGEVRIDPVGEVGAAVPEPSGGVMTSFRLVASVDCLVQLCHVDGVVALQVDRQSREELIDILVCVSNRKETQDYGLEQPLVHQISQKPDQESSLTLLARVVKLEVQRTGELTVTSQLRHQGGVDRLDGGVVTLLEVFVVRVGVYSLTVNEHAHQVDGDTQCLVAGVGRDVEVWKCVQALVGGVHNHAHGVHQWVDTLGPADVVQLSLQLHEVVVVDHGLLQIGTCFAGRLLQFLLPEVDTVITEGKSQVSSEFDAGTYWIGSPDLHEVRVVDLDLRCGLVLEDLVNKSTFRERQEHELTVWRHLVVSGQLVHEQDDCILLPGRVETGLGH